MKRWLMLIIALYATNAGARALHIGDASVPLSDTKNTSPALAVNVNDKIYYGALFSDTPAEKTLRVRFNGADYWLGEFCSPGTYAPSGTNTCIACGIGHYCTGGHHRAACTGGAIACNGTNHSSDATAPAGAPINKFMTLAEVESFIPPTDISQWRRISCCNNNNDIHDPNDIRAACASGTLTPGTYLFILRYYDSWSTDSLTGDTGGISDVNIAVFDHLVEYRSVHFTNVYQSFVDTENYPFESWTITHAPYSRFWEDSTNETNVTNIPSEVEFSQICVYELK